MNSCMECFDELETKDVKYCPDCGLALCEECLKSHECPEEDE